VLWLGKRLILCAQPFSIRKLPVNLDYKNKKGLAVALAQIVASRAQQRNFQRKLTHSLFERVAFDESELMLPGLRCSSPHYS